MASPLELVEQHYRNVSSANIDAEDELFSPDVETIDPGAGTLRGLPGSSRTFSRSTVPASRDTAFTTTRSSS